MWFLRAGPAYPENDHAHDRAAEVSEASPWSGFFSGLLPCLRKPGTGKQGVVFVGEFYSTESSCCGMRFLSANYSYAICTELSVANNG